MKRCNRCKEVKLLELFYRNRSKKDKSSTFCKICSNVDVKKRVLKRKKDFRGLYTVWVGMKHRCLYPKNANYKYYGSRGITVCKEWQDSFQVFYKWAKDKHREGLELDRRDNNGSYHPENCRFTTHKENSRNSSQTKLNITQVKIIKRLLKKGELLHKEISKMFSVNVDAIYKIKNKKSWEDIKICFIVSSGSQSQQSLDM